MVDYRTRRPKHGLTIGARRTRQLFWSMPHYGHELARIRGPAQFFEWIYYKFPRFFPLRSFPSVVTLELTNECNFRCPHCPRIQLNEGRELGFMKLAVFRKIARESAGRVTAIKLIGLGEPALHPELCTMMRLLSENGIGALLYTNGTLFDHHSPAEICSWGLSVVVVSVDGTDERSFSRLRAGGDYRALRAKLAEFRKFRDDFGKRSPHIEIRHVMMPNETPAMLRKFRADWLNGLGDTVKCNLLGPPYGERRKEDPLRPPCRDIRREMHIRFDGRVPLCGYDGQTEWIGNVSNSSLREIWTSARLQDVRNRHQQRDLSELPFCRTCQHR